MNKETAQFISDHINDNLFELRLIKKLPRGVDIDLAIRQITGKQKIKSKVPLFYNTDGILYPAQLSLEQSSSETTARYKASLCEGNMLVDLTGGFGVDCCFMSERFKQAVYVERQAVLCELAKHNYPALNKHHIKIIHAETEDFLTGMSHADWIYLDPARRNEHGGKVVYLRDCEPDITVISEQLLAKTGHVMVKLSPMMDVTAALNSLPYTREVHIISIDNECKEVLLVMNHNEQNAIKIRTINLGKQQQVFDFELKEEENVVAAFSAHIGKYLYEPNAAVMKSGAFKLVGVRFGMSKLHINTHLYTSDYLSENFPGRIFGVQKIWDTSKKGLKEELHRVPKANISTRNYPMRAEELRSKLRIKDGGDVYLFACTVADNQKLIIECTKSV